MELRKNEEGLEKTAADVDNDSFEFEKEVIVEEGEGEDGKIKKKKYRNAYASKIRERCDTIVGTANYLSPEVIM